MSVFYRLSKKSGPRSLYGESYLEKFRFHLLLALTTGLVLSILFFWISTSYYRIDVPSSLFAGGNDGWCEVPNESIGVHCFGDFNERIGLMAGDPQKDLVETSPIGPLITIIGNFVASVSSPKIALVAALVIYIACVLFPALVATRKASRADQLRAALLLSLGTYPFIMVLDRGQSLAIAAPLMYLYLIGALKQDVRQVSIAVIALATIRPVFLGLSPLLLILGKPRRFLLTLIGGLLSPLTLLVVTGPGGTSRITEWVDTSRQYANSFREVNASLNPNASLSAVIYGITELLSVVPEPLQIDLRTSAVQISHVMAAIVASVITLGLVLVRRHVSPVLSAIALLAVFSLSFGKHVGPYYLVFALAVGALIFSDSTAESPFLNRQPITSSVLFAALVMTCSPTIIPLIPANWFELQLTGTLIQVRTLNIPLAVFLWFSFCISLLAGGFRSAFICHQKR